MSLGKSGYLKIGAFKETPVLMHWTFPIGCIIIALIFQAKYYEVIFICGAYAALILLHEAGHAVAAIIFGIKVYSIELTGFGGICRTDTPLTRKAALLYSSAGLIAQLALLSAAVSYINRYGQPSSMVGSSIAFVSTAVNGLLILINIIPSKHSRNDYGTDGYILWKLIIQIICNRPYSYPDTSATFSPNINLVGLDGFTPKGFKFGIEILNDNTTTMQFIVEIFIKHLNLSHEEAVKTMLTIHNRGGVVIALDTYEHAQQMSSAICNDAKREGYSLVCRPVRSL